MKRQNVQDAYKRVRPDGQTKERMLEAILSAASDLPPERKDTAMKKIPSKSLLIAAVIGLMIFLMGCAVVAMNLQDMKIGEHTYTQPRYIDENGEKIPAKEVTTDVISLQGISGSPSQQAAQEWYVFEQGYDMDGVLLDEADKNPIDVPREYDAYFVYTQEMIDKVDEIAAKYGLELAGAFAGTQDYETDIFFESLGLTDLHREEAGAEIEYADGYFYACGNFNMNFYITLPDGEENWAQEILASMRYCDKGYLDTVFVYLSNIESCEQWNYTLADGREVLIVTGNDRAMIFCDTDSAFISVSFSTNYNYDDGTAATMTKRDVELVADVVDFTVVPQKPDMAEAQRRIDESFANWKAEQEALAATREDPWPTHNSYEEKIRFLLEKGDIADAYYYALWDVNDDGVEDLLLGHKDSFGPIYTVYNGEVYGLLSFGMDQGSYLCNDNVILHHDKFANPNGYYFYKIGEVSENAWEIYQCIDEINYDEWEEQWYRILGGDDSTRTYLTEDEAMAVIESYGRVDPGVKPISEFPMGE